MLFQKIIIGGDNYIIQYLGIGFVTLIRVSKILSDLCVDRWTVKIVLLLITYLHDYSTSNLRAISQFCDPQTEPVVVRPPIREHVHDERRWKSEEDATPEPGG